MRSVISSTPSDTIAAGRALAASLNPGTTIALIGNLGAGKTHFVQGLVQGWDSPNHATSPTFALLHEYHTPRGPIHHLDLYRAKSTEEIWSAAYDEIYDPSALVVMEWADRFPELLPADSITVTITATSETSRTISIAP